MRFTGKLKTWDEARGLGLISPIDGGQDIRVHVSELPPDGRPDMEQLLSFEVALDAAGAKKAVHLQPVSVHRYGLASTAAAASGRSRWVLALLVLVLAGGGAAFGYRQYQRSVVHTVRIATPQPATPDPLFSAMPPGAAPAGTAPGELSAPVPAAAYRCDGRTRCSQMRSCAEATYFLQNCPGVTMDGNNDGVPCEQQWCH